MPQIIRARSGFTLAALALASWLACPALAGQPSSGKGTGGAPGLGISTGQEQQQVNQTNQTQAGYLQSTSMYQAVYPGAGHVRIGDDHCQTPTGDSRLAISGSGVFSDPSFETYGVGLTYSRTWQHTGLMGKACEQYAALQLKIQELEVQALTWQNETRRRNACAEILKNTFWVEGGVLFRAQGIQLPEWCGNLTVQTTLIRQQVVQSPAPRQAPPSPSVRTESAPKGG